MIGAWHSSPQVDSKHRKVVKSQLLARLRSDICTGDEGHFTRTYVFPSTQPHTVFCWKSNSRQASKKLTSCKQLVTQPVTVLRLSLTFLELISQVSTVNLPSFGPAAKPQLVRNIPVDCSSAKPIPAPSANLCSSSGCPAHIPAGQPYLRHLRAHRS